MKMPEFTGGVSIEKVAEVLKRLWRKGAIVLKSGKRAHGQW
jgi:hypothetical protein